MADSKNNDIQSGKSQEIGSYELFGFYDSQTNTFYSIPQVGINEINYVITQLQALLS